MFCAVLPYQVDPASVPTARLDDLDAVSFAWIRRRVLLPSIRVVTDVEVSVPSVSHRRDDLFRRNFRVVALFEEGRAIARSSAPFGRRTRTARPPGRLGSPCAAGRRPGGRRRDRPGSPRKGPSRRRGRNARTVWRANGPDRARTPAPDRSLRMGRRVRTRGRERPRPTAGRRLRGSLGSRQKQGAGLPAGPRAAAAAEAAVRRVRGSSARPAGRRPWPRPWGSSCPRRRSRTSRPPRSRRVWPPRRSRASLASRSTAGWPGCT